MLPEYDVLQVEGGLQCHYGEGYLARCCVED